MSSTTWPIRDELANVLSRDLPSGKHMFPTKGKNAANSDNFGVDDYNKMIDAAIGKLKIGAVDEIDSNAEKAARDKSRKMMEEIRNEMYGASSVRGMIPIAVESIPFVQEMIDAVSAKVSPVTQSLEAKLKTSFLDPRTKFHGAEPEIDVQTLLCTIEKQAAAKSFDDEGLVAGLVAMRQLRVDANALDDALGKLLEGKQLLDSSNKPMWCSDSTPLRDAKSSIGLAIEDLDKITETSKLMVQLTDQQQVDFKYWHDTIKNQAILEHEFERLRAANMDLISQFDINELASTEGTSPAAIRHNKLRSPPGLGDDIAKCMNRKRLPIEDQWKDCIWITRTWIAYWLTDTLTGDKDPNDGYRHYFCPENFQPPSATVRNGVVEYGGCAMDREYWVQYWTSLYSLGRNKEFHSYVTRKTDLTLFCAKMMGIQRALNTIWTYETKRKVYADHSAVNYNDYFATVSAFKVLRANVEALKARMVAARFISAEINCAVRDLQADLMGGEAFEVLIDIERLRTSLSQLKEWSADMETLHITGFPSQQVASGAVQSVANLAPIGLSPNRSPPVDLDIAAGITHIDMHAVPRLRLSIMRNSSPSAAITPHMATWKGSALRQADCRWIAVPRVRNRMVAVLQDDGITMSPPPAVPDAPIIEFGETPEGAFAPLPPVPGGCAAPQKQQYRINFSPEFAHGHVDAAETRAHFACWLTRVDLRGGGGGSGGAVECGVAVVKRARSYAVVELTVGGGEGAAAELAEVRVGWAAYHNTRGQALRIWDGRAELLAPPPHQSEAGAAAVERLTSPSAGHYFEFGKGVFEDSGAPQYMAAIHSVSFAPGNTWNKVGLQMSVPCKEGIWVGVVTDYGDKVNSCGVTLLAIS